eukprot:6213671-Pleurochrysis_carterae.AAC.1
MESGRAQFFPTQELLAMSVAALPGVLSVGRGKGAAAPHLRAGGGSRRSLHHTRMSHSPGWRACNLLMGRRQPCPWRER